MSIEDPRDLIGAYVLDACTPEEAAEVRAHMTASAEFRAEVESFGAVRDALLEAPEPEVAASPGLKRSIMAQVQAEASLFAAAGPSERAAIVREGRSSDPLPGSTAGPSPASAPRGTGEPAPSPRRTAFLEALRHPARATALAAVLVALIVGGIVVGSGGGDDGAAPEQYIGQFTDPARSKNATVKMVADGDRHEIQVHGFVAAGTGKQYQVWLRSGDEAPKPTKVLFDVDPRGNARAVVEGDMSNVDDVLVTAEPEGGSVAPTSQPVFHVQI